MRLETLDRRRRTRLLGVLTICAALAATLLAAGPGQAVVPATTWARQFGSGGSDVGLGVAVGGGGGVVVGWTDAGLEGSSLGDRDAFVRALDGSGGVRWTRQFGTAGGDLAAAAAVDAAGAVYVVGTVGAGSGGGLPGQVPVGGADAFVRKYDGSGAEVWTRQFGSSAVDGAGGVAVDAAGAVYVVGFAGAGLPGQGSSAGAFVRKYDASGAELWTRQFSGASAGAVAVAGGAVYVAGSASAALPGQVDAGSGDGFVRRYDGSGAEVWTRQFGTSAREGVAGVAVDGAGAVLVTGSTGGAFPGEVSSGLDDVFVRKLDASGGVVWTRQFGSQGGWNDWGQGVVADAAGNVFVAGRTFGRLPGQPDGRGDAFVRKYDPSGVEVWTRQLGSGDAQDGAAAIALDQAGAIHLAGETSGALPQQTNAGLVDAFVTKLAVPERPWARGPVTVRFEAQDLYSGIEPPGSRDLVVDGEGTDLRVTGSFLDRAGIRGSLTVDGIRIDSTAPTVVFGEILATPNPAGWYRADVPIAFTVEDGLSGVASSSPATGPLVVAGEGAAVTGTVSVTDVAGNSAERESPPVRIDKTPPQTTASVDPPVEGGRVDAPRATVSLASTDAVSGVAGIEIAVDGAAWAPYAAPVVVAGAGSHVVRYRATDVAGNVEEAREVGFELAPPETPPAVDAGSDAALDEGGSLTRAGSFADPDSTGWTATVDYGDGSGVQPLVVGAARTFELQHAYVDDGTYLVTVAVTDAEGLVGTDTVEVVVANVAPSPGSIEAPTSPVPVGATVDAGVSFADPGIADAHTATWDWGDGTTSAGVVSGRAVAGGHAYATAGVYTVTATVSDDDGGTGTVALQYVVVYDPDGGFVTGGGWIDSPAGAYVADPTLTGRASFGFVAKYQKGASAPTGETEFRFRVAGLSFRSTAYEYLVVAGARAQYKGTGTIGGQGRYGFLLTALDGDLPGGGGVDRFRIKIVDLDAGTLVYDNQQGAADGTDPATALGGGSIVIRR